MKYKANTRQLVSIIGKTKLQKLKWVRMDTLKSYLRNQGQSLDDIPLIHGYLISLQKARYIFDYSGTYISGNNNEIFILSREKYHRELRLDVLSLNNDLDFWQKIHLNPIELMRLKNAIECSGTILKSPEELLSLILTYV